MPGYLILLCAALYLCFVYSLARWGEQRAARGLLRGRGRAVLHGLALGVYCSTWTVFGAIGSALRDGYVYLAIYLGPLLVALFAPMIWERLVALKQRHRLASVADFLGARYGQAGALAALVAVVSLAAVVPYVALQLTALSGALRAIGVLFPTAWVVLFALLMVLFTLRFGVQDARTVAERTGLVLLLSIESLFKLIILIALALWAAFLVGGTPLDWHQAMLAGPSNARALDVMANQNGWTALSTFSLIGQTILAAAASLLLPRMFQVAVVECADLRELKLARLVFSSYLILACVAVIPIAVLAGAGTGMPSPDSDFSLISMPLARAQSALALLALLAGISAASAMMIASWLALSTMLTNDLLLPMLLKFGTPVSATRVLKLRRSAVMCAAVLSVIWFALSPGDTLLRIGLLAFAGVAQFAPVVLAGLFAARSNRHAAFVALSVGALLWLFLMVLPALSDASLSTAELVARALIALGCNTVTLLIFSAFKPASFRQRLLANQFLSAADAISDAPDVRTPVRIDDLYALSEKLLGTGNYRNALQAQLGTRLPAAAGWAHSTLLTATERAIAEVFGSVTARALIARGLSGQELGLDAILEALDQSSSRVRMSAQLLNTTFEHMHQAVSVVDSDLNLAAWNRRYEQLFTWPPGMLAQGQPIAALIRHTASEYGLSESQIDARVAKRLLQLQAATPYRSQRTLPDGRTLDVRGEPLPNGGFVTTFFDISNTVQAANALESANAELALANTTLEARVAARTRDLERLSLLKNQFLAAASHDLLQPLSAARLYLAAALDCPSDPSLLSRADSALSVSEELLSGLTDLARLEMGQLRPELAAVDIGALLTSLIAQSQALASQRGLQLRLHPTGEWAMTDAKLLRRILQNYLANAQRYTASGGVLIGIRAAGADAFDIVVYDTGPGIDADTLSKLFGTLDASATTSPWGERGFGLGLSGCKRLADLLGHHVFVRSRLGRGSCFGVRVPRTTAKAPAVAVALPVSGLQQLCVLCVDDHDDVLQALSELLERWGARVYAARSCAQAQAYMQNETVNLALIDYSLGAGEPNGLELIAQLRQAKPNLVAALLTAETNPSVPQWAAEANVSLIKKPIRPAALRAFLESLRA